MAEGKFVTVVNCMDGRTQVPVIEYLKEEYGADYVDCVTEAGPDGHLACGSACSESIRERVMISVEKHGSKVVAIVGHHDCAGNPVDEETHKKQILEGVGCIKKWFPQVEAVGVWVGKDWVPRRI